MKIRERYRSLIDFMKQCVISLLSLKIIYYQYFRIICDIIFPKGLGDKLKAIKAARVTKSETAKFLKDTMQLKA